MATVMLISENSELNVGVVKDIISSLKKIRDNNLNVVINKTDKEELKSLLEIALETVNSSKELLEG